MNTSFYFYSVSGAAHEMAVRPMDRNRAEIGIFLDRLVLGREPLMIETQVERIGTPATRKKITLSDFIRSVSGRKTADSRPRTDCIDVRPAWSATKTYRDRSSLKTGNRLRPCRRQPGRTTPGIGDC